jgi:hypothetical protein
MEFGAFALEVRVHGRVVKEYRHDEEVWVEGRKGTEFVLRLENRSNKRILAVPTIDGLSVMDGKEASFDSNGYVLGPYQHLDIPGWRLDNDKVASFRFNKTGKSYAEKTGKGGNVGIIGCAFFEEVRPVIDYSKIVRTCDLSHTRHHPGIRVRKGTGDGAVMDFAPSSFCSFDKGSQPNWTSGDGSETKCSADMGQARGMSANCSNIQPDCYHQEAAPVAPSLGTEFGEQMDHRVVTTTFNRPAKPAVEMTLRYGDREELKQRGVDFDQRPVAAHKPSAFPKEEVACKPPPGWSGR